LKINLLRPVFPDAELRDLTATGRVIHRGRTLSVADAEVRGVDGQVVAVGRGTSMLTTELDVPSA
jgi:acyl-coenzyme A thioesterase PaaI-like protein